MKKYLCICLTLVIAALCGCSSIKSEFNTVTKKENSITHKGIWISYTEVNQMLESGVGFKKEFDTVLNNCQKFGINNIYLHVRPFADSLFKSDYYPINPKAAVCDFDVLEYAVSSAHSKSIKLHAWINPYRIRTADSNIDALSQDNPAYKWLKDENPDNDINVCFNDGIYLNPSSLQVRELVINGIREIISKYNVDGIHFDDYFYPTADPSFDSKSYTVYTSQCENPLSLDDWRRANVNSLVSSCYTAIKFEKKDVLFTVSPAASIEKNYSNLYADISLWAKNNYIDYLIPQLYFGFQYPDETYCFDNLLARWEEAVKGTDVKLIIGLAPYKIGIQTGNDKHEWNNYTDILKRQVELCSESKATIGYVMYSYSSFFSEEELNKKQRNNLLISQE